MTLLDVYKSCLLSCCPMFNTMGVFVGLPRSCLILWGLSSLGYGIFIRFTGGCLLCSIMLLYTLHYVCDFVTLSC